MQQHLGSHDLNYQQPRPRSRGETAADMVPWFGGAVAIIGALILTFAFMGRDDAWRIDYGLTITGFGITWWILGIILRVLVFKRD